MIRTIIAAVGVLLVQGGVQAQDHTIIALSHSDFTAYELDPATGRIVNQFTADNQPHEGVVAPDGKTIFAAIPQGPHVVILDAQTFKQIGKIESEYFTRPPLCEAAETRPAPQTAQHVRLPSWSRPQSRREQALHRCRDVGYSRYRGLRRPCRSSLEENRPPARGRAFSRNRSADGQAVLPSPLRQSCGRTRHEDRPDSEDHSRRGRPGRRGLHSE